MPLVVLPLKMIAFQSLLLMVAIAIEAMILRQRLRLTQKQSVHYAASINFLATAVGWVLFLSIQSLAPQPLKLELLNGLFFDQWQQGVVIWVVLAAMVTFFMSFLIKLVGLIQLRSYLGERRPEPEPPGPRKFGASRMNKGASGISSQGQAILVANALSYSAVSLILLIRLLIQSRQITL